MTAWKKPCTLVATTDIALADLPEIDGVSVAAGDRVLVAGQTAAAENGVYSAVTGPWARTADANTALSLSRMAVRVKGGRTASFTDWALATTVPITLGTTALRYARLPPLTGADPTSILVSVDAFGAAGDGTTDDTGAFKAALGSMTNGGVLMLGPKTYAVTSLSLPSGVTLRGQGDASVLKATADLRMIEVAAGSPRRDVVLEDLTLDANRIAAHGLVGNGADFDSVMIRRCRFVNLGNGQGVALKYGRSLLVEDCLFDGGGLCTAAGVVINVGFDDIRIVGSTFRGLNSGLTLSSPGTQRSQQHVTIERCMFDMMYYTAAALPLWTGSGSNVSYTATTLTDTSKTFVVEERDRRGALCQWGYVRALPVRAAGTTGACTATQLVAANGGFLSAAIKRGELVRVGNAQGIILSVDSDTAIHVEGWFEQATQEPARVPASGQAFTVHGVLLGKVDSGSGAVLTLSGGVWADLDGVQVTPTTGTLYEGLPITNYPITSRETAGRVRVLANTFLRAYTDQVSPFGDECEIASNVIVDGQDYGITLAGTTMGEGGRHDIHDNLIVRQGSGGIYLGGGRSLVHDNRIIGWGARGAKVNTPTAGPSAIVMNPAGVGASMAGTICHHNVIDGAGLPEALYGVSAGGGCVDMAIEDNHVTGAVRHEINVSGSTTRGLRIRHRTSDVIYTAVGKGGQAEGQLSDTSGPENPVGLLFAAPGSRHVDTRTGMLWLKATRTDASGWQFAVTQAFDPRAVPDLFLWHRADSLSSSPVPSWEDGSGSGDPGRNLTQIAGAAQQPTWIAADPQFNNHPVVVLDDASFLEWGTFSRPLDQPATWMVVCQQTDSGLAFVVGGSAGNRQDILDNSSSKVEITDGTTSLTVPTTGDGFDTFFAKTTACIAVFNRTSSSIYVRNVRASVTGNAGTGSMKTGCIGIHPDRKRFPFIGKIAEIAAWSRVLTKDEITTLMRYTRVRYGIILKG
jgi:hypothetical protein